MRCQCRRQGVYSAAGHGRFEAAPGGPRCALFWVRCSWPVWRRCPSGAGQPTTHRKRRPRELTTADSSTTELAPEDPILDGAPEEETDADRTRDWFVEEKADQIIKAAGDLLARTQRFSFRAETMEEEVLESGAKIDTSREGTIHVRRPNGLFVERHDISGARKLYYDGRTAALLDVPTNLYVMTEEAPS